MANVTQFFIDGSKTRHIFKIKGGKYFYNNKEITKDDYDAALIWFNANRLKKK